MAVASVPGKTVHKLAPEGLTSEDFDRIFFDHHPEADLARELWPKLSDKARRRILGYAGVGDFDFASELLLMFAVEEGVVVPQWVIDAGDKLEEHWGWSPNVEKACAALQARLDEHNRGGGE